MTVDPTDLVIWLIVGTMIGWAASNFMVATRRVTLFALALSGACIGGLLLTQLEILRSGASGSFWASILGALFLLSIFSLLRE